MDTGRRNVIKTLLAAGGGSLLDAQVRRAAPAANGPLTEKEVKDFIVANYQKERAQTENACAVSPERFRSANANEILHLEEGATLVSLAGDKWGMYQETDRIFAAARNLGSVKSMPAKPLIYESSKLPANLLISFNSTSDPNKNAVLYSNVNANQEVLHAWLKHEIAHLFFAKDPTLIAKFSSDRVTELKTSLRAQGMPGRCVDQSIEEIAADNFARQLDCIRVPDRADIRPGGVIGPRRERDILIQSQSRGANRDMLSEFLAVNDRVNVTRYVSVIIALRERFRERYTSLPQEQQVALTDFAFGVLLNNRNHPTAAARLYYSDDGPGCPAPSGNGRGK